MAASDSAGELLGAEGDAAASAATTLPAGEAADVLLPIEEMAEAKLVLTDALIAEALRRSKQPSAASSDAVSATAQQNDNQARRHGRTSKQSIPAPVRRTPARRPARRRMSDGCQRQQARAAADRGCGRPREVDRPHHRGHRDGGCHRQGGAFALRRGDRRARRDQSQDRRAAAVTPSPGGGQRREHVEPDQRRGAPRSEIPPPRSATPSPMRCRRSNTAASPRNRPSR